MRGSILDMYRRPDKLLAASERIMARLSPAEPRSRGNPKRAGGAILRSTDGFMSKEQFETFYWPA